MQSNPNQPNLRWSSNRERNSQTRKKAGFRHIGIEQAEKGSTQKPRRRFSIKALLSDRPTLLRAGALSLLVILLLVTAVIGNIPSGLFAPSGTSILPAQTSPPSALEPTPVPAAAKTATPASGAPDYFANFHNDRARVREQELALLNEAIAADSAAKDEAVERKTALTAQIEAEFSIEQTLIAKGFPNAACIVRDDSATIAVKKAPLSQSDTAIILSAALDATALTADDIKVVAVP